MKRHTFLALSILVLGVPACSGGDETEAGSPNKPKETTALVGAAGVTITQVAIYQGVKRALMLDGAQASSPIPLVAGRDAFLRIFYTTDAGYDGGEVTGQLLIDGGEPIQATGVLGAGSNDADLGSTFNLAIPGDRIGDVLTYSVGLLHDGHAKDDNAAARYPASGTDAVPVEGKRNTLKVILAPFAYNADGSGRVPDMSPEQVEKYRQRFLGMYPVSNVEVTVRQATPWSGKIYANGQGWQEVGYALYGFRQQDKTPDDVYYYGVFDPSPSLGQYCGGGCLLGVTLLNNDPPETGSVGLRLALGVGFPEVAADTAAHETGHAHGREHANCGPGLDPASIDPNFPHPDGQIGEWGFDVQNSVLYDPVQTTDIMGYCEHTWISDYNYQALFHRGQAVNGEYWKAAPTQRVDYELLTVDGEGHAVWRGPVTQSRAFLGTGVEGTVVGRDGTRAAITGHYFPYDHLPGGWLLFPRSEGASRAEFVVDGVRAVAER